MNYLTKDDLLDLHAYVVTRYGGRLGLASLDRLLTAIEAPRQVMFGTELYPDLPSKAAAMAFLLLKNRPFLSGNEATALLALLRLLAINDVELRAEVDGQALAEVIRSVNRSLLDRDGLEAWVRDALQPKVA